MKTSTVGFVITLVLFISTASACKCVVTSIRDSYFSSDTDRFVEAKPIIILPPGATSRLYVFRVTKVYKGCPLKVFIAETSLSSASCGINFKRGVRYVIPLPKDITGVIPLNSCQFVRSFFSLTKDDVTFLSHRNVCCKKSCQCSNGSRPFNCLVQPCSLAKCSASTTCVDNYCGGCFAECVPL